MSYKQAVLRDDPIAYWPLTGTVNLRTYATLLEEYATYQEFLLSEDTYGYQPGSFYFEDLSINSNHAAVSFGTHLPIFQDVLTLNSRSFNDTNINGCKITDTSIVSIYDIYSFFDKNQENKIFGAEFWVFFNDNPSTNVNLLSVYDSLSQINVFEVYAYNNAIYLTVRNSTESYTTKKEIFSWDKKINIFVSYSERNIEIMVNGIADETVLIPNTFKFIGNDYPYLKYKIGPAETGKNFIINDLAFYTRKLSVNEIRNHMVWANINSDPEFAALQGSAYHFNIKERNEMIHLQKIFTKPEDYNLGVYSNLIPDKNGLKIQQTSAAGSQTGYWQYNFPIVQYTNFAGVDISWDSGFTPNSSIANMEYVKVYSSYDNGQTWNQVYSNKIVPYFLSRASNASAAQLLVKVIMNSTNTSDELQPRLDNLRITIYKNLNLPSDSGEFILSPVASQTYMIRQNEDTLISRDRNFGIHFVNQNPNSGYPGTALINSVNNAEYRTIEFWFKYEGCQNNTLGAVLDTATVNGVDLYVNPSTSVLTSNLGSNGTLYVNGLAQNNGYTIVPGETYHITLIYNQSTSNQIYINGSTDGLSTPLQAMYGFITLFPNKLSSSEIQSRYLSYITIKSTVVYDSTTSLGSVVEYSGSKPTSINGGLPVISHDHTY
jgi:hypothetical protein